MDLHISVILIAVALILGYLFGLSEGSALVEGFQASRYPM